MHPALSAFEAIDVHANGLKFRVRTAGEGKRLALLLHGFPECWFSWRDQIPLLAELGYRVWAPDLRGYGDSDKPAGVEAYRMNHLLKDIAGLIDASGAEEVLLIGHDWGGMVAWEFASRQVRPLTRFVAMNIPHPALFRKHFFRLGPQIARSYYMFVFQVPKLSEHLLRKDDYRGIAGAFLGMTTDKSRFPKEVIDVFKDSAAKPGALTAMLSWYRASFRYQRIEGKPSKINVPTLLLWGEQDKALGKELTYGTSKYVKDLTTRYIPSASHWVQQDTPEVVNAMLRAWLEGERVPEAHELGA